MLTRPLNPKTPKPQNPKRLILSWSDFMQISEISTVLCLFFVCRLFNWSFHWPRYRVEQSPSICSSGRPAPGQTHLLRLVCLFPRVADWAFRWWWSGPRYCPSWRLWKTRGVGHLRRFGKLRRLTLGLWETVWYHRPWTEKLGGSDQRQETLLEEFLCHTLSRSHVL